MFQQIKTKGNVEITITQQFLAYENAIEPLLQKLDTHKGALFASSFEFPGRYTCWDIGFYNPPLALIYKKNTVFLQALNERGELLLAILLPMLKTKKEILIQETSNTECSMTIKPTNAIFSEEERSLQPSVFTIIRAISDFFYLEDDLYLGLYGALGYDLVFQFESLKQTQERIATQRDLVLYLPDEIYVVNHPKEEAFIKRYEFHYQNYNTQGLIREGEVKGYTPKHKPAFFCDHKAGEYAGLVDEAKKRFACGDLFEVVPSQTFSMHCLENPSEIFRKMRLANPSPYGFFINLGEEEYLVGASPEMYVRVKDRQVETCPISGTIKRGANAIEDALHIQQLLASEKEASELTMCTDVDRNDKSRVCEPGSVQVVGRRQIEMYSRLIHTVDHVKGTLRKGFDAIDAFLSHMWVVTVTGAPKLWAMNFIESHEKSPRRWYGGAVGWFGFNGNINTGLVLRTLRIEQGIAEIRVGATLLYDSVPEEEEKETQLKACAFIDLLKAHPTPAHAAKKPYQEGKGKTILLVDHQDSFVHTLANYLRQTQAQVITVRNEHALDYLQKNSIDLIVLSPGPGKPKDFKLEQTIKAALEKNIPLFGVCLGLQGIVEYFGGELGILDYPMHGKASEIIVEDDSDILEGLAPSFMAGRYHSLYALETTFPEALKVTARTADGIIMAVSHKTLPIHAVQFHPETILSLPKEAGMHIIANVMRVLTHA